MTVYRTAPQVMTPDVEEALAPSMRLAPVATCWDFSFYHILIKPDTTYYTEVMSLPENFRLRYWSPRPDDAPSLSVLLEIFYPDSRGVNVFVGGDLQASDIALHVSTDPQLVMSVEILEFRVHGQAQRDLVVRRTPTVKLKMNIEISIEEFNAEQFQTNLAILLGIPPERIVVAAVQVRRRLGLVATTEADIDPSEDSDEWEGSGGRRLAVVSSTALDVSIEPSPDAAGIPGETLIQNTQGVVTSQNAVNLGTEALNAQTSELNQVTIEEVQTPAEPDEANNEQVPSAEETAAVQIIDITAVAETTAAAEVSAEVTVGSSQGIVYPTVQISARRAGP
ncbi:hypothetical protein AK812_SmicGene9142 [Symbiodinium microadriaticum]|uniref:Uncharacterized protein n=1 Tax=Symbiodinium microadriaticum TaxID=2951 RepID=A0A1Q9EJ49_SYMMI|nr:hypothetical protein AK812_SmicGene9142 [Symbiodinium microadriaticum]